MVPAVEITPSVSNESLMVIGTPCSGPLISPRARATSACLAADANMGTWKLNEAKSTIPAGVPKNNTVVYAAVGDMVKLLSRFCVGDA